MAANEQANDEYLWRDRHLLPFHEKALQSADEVGGPSGGLRALPVDPTLQWRQGIIPTWKLNIR
jgi:hypothetical protein